MSTGRDIPADYDERSVNVSERKDEAAGVKAVVVTMQRAWSRWVPSEPSPRWHGSTNATVSTAGLRMARGTRQTASCRVLRERRQGGGRGGHQAPGHPGVLRPPFGGRAGRQARVLAVPAGRLTHPMVLRPGAQHYTPIGWDDAYRLIAEHLNGLHPRRSGVSTPPAAPATRPRSSNQLLVRSFGTNNLPDCSNMCHESSGTALIDSIGVGKGSVTVDDIEHADVIVIAGQNPGTNHPRMLYVLEKAKANGAKIIAVNPLPEAGLIRFKDPQKVHGVVGHGCPSPTSSSRFVSAATSPCSKGWAGCCWRPTTAPPAA